MLYTCDFLLLSGIHRRVLLLCTLAFPFHFLYPLLSYRERKQASKRCASELQREDEYLWTFRFWASEKKSFRSFCFWALCFLAFPLLSFRERRVILFFDFSFMFFLLLDRFCYLFSLRLDFKLFKLWLDSNWKHYCFGFNYICAEIRSKWDLDSNLYFTKEFFTDKNKNACFHFFFSRKCSQFKILFDLIINCYRDKSIRDK